MPQNPQPDGPERIESNPGVGVTARINMRRGERSWTEEVDVVAIAAEVLAQHGFQVRSYESWLEHPESGLILQPGLAHMQSEDKGVSIVSTVQINHRDLVPHGVFEYQHAAGDDVADALHKGFDQWVRLDFLTFLDALGQQPIHSNYMQMEFPADDERPLRIRRAVLGPPGRYLVQKPGAKPPPPPSGEDGEHDYCPCCLMTRSFEAFQKLIESNDFYAIRMFAARDSNGQAQADCRVNGQDYEAGAVALRQYAATWPESSYEFRKQYVILQTIAPEMAIQGTSN